MRIQCDIQKGKVESERQMSQEGKVRHTKQPKKKKNKKELWHAYYDDKQHGIILIPLIWFIFHYTPSLYYTLSTSERACTLN